MSARHTLEVLDGVLGPRPGRWLTEGVELHEPGRHEPCRGSEAVSARIQAFVKLLDDAGAGDVKLTVDEGRGAVEWVVRPGAGPPQTDVRIVCVFEIEDDLVGQARLYYDRAELNPGQTS